MQSISLIAVPGNIMTSRHVGVYALNYWVTRSINGIAMPGKRMTCRHIGVSVPTCLGCSWLHTRLLLATCSSRPDLGLGDALASLAPLCMLVGTCLGQTLLHSRFGRREGGSQGLLVRDTSGILQCHVEYTCV